MIDQWSPESWKSRPLRQRVVYPDVDALNEALKKLSRFPPLVTSWEVERLKTQIAAAAEGRAFLLQIVFEQDVLNLVERLRSPLGKTSSQGCQLAVRRLLFRRRQHPPQAVDLLAGQQSMPIDPQQFAE